MSNIVERVRNTYNEYPKQFWVLIGSSFIDSIGGSMMFPYFTLYLTKRFGVGMTQVGLVFSVFSITGLVGSTVGGALTDRWGRRTMLMFGLVTSALSSLLMGLANTFGLFILVALVVGMLSHTGMPAQRAMVADLLPPHQRTQGYAMLRVVHNLAVAIGPAVGGFIAIRSYMALFVTDAVASSITAVIVYLAIRETRPVSASEAAGEKQPSILKSFGGYSVALRNGVFMLFMGAYILQVMAAQQMFGTLGVFMRDVRGFTEQNFGLVVTTNGLMVVLFQFPITHLCRNIPRLRLMALGALFYAVGLLMYGLVTPFGLFLVAMAIATIGETMTAPTSQAMAAELAPEDMRGRFMAVYGLSWSISSAVAPTLAGVVMDAGHPYWVWYGASALALVAALAYMALQRRALRAEASAQPA
ncbi:MAG: MFS transporter [Chloroflexi bacterium]|nr:MFS transporter [Chloroflexota bacterium]